jgi:hypothetical protein
LATDFTTDSRFDNPRAVQIRLSGFTHDKLVEVGKRVRDLYAEGSPQEDRIRRVVDDAYLVDLGSAVAGDLGGKVGIAPRLFLKKLVSDILDRVDQFPDFDPREHYRLTISTADMNNVERNAAAQSADDIDLEI